MKKLLLLATLFLGVLGGKAQDNGNISATFKVDSDNQNATLTVSLNSTTSLVAFQMDVQLPEGHTYTIGEITKGASLINGRSNSLGSTDFVIASNFVADNVLRLVAYNLGNVAIDVAKGAELFHVTFTADAALEGDATAWTATFDTEKTIFVTAADLEEIKLAIAGDNVEEGNLVRGENAGLIGDADGNGVVEMADALLVMRAVLGELSESEVFVFDNANVFDTESDHGNINMADFLGVIEIVLSQM